LVNSPESPFLLVSKDGVGNYLNYGIRTMLVAETIPEPGWDNETIYLGMANPFNLETASGEKQGGWELIQLSRILTRPPGDTTTSIAATTTTAPPTTTTTIPGGGKLCPIKKTLGTDNPKLQKFRSFRDSQLASSAAGRMIISTYYKNADTINAALERSPVLRSLASLVIIAVSSAMGGSN
jgi:hypothetical protein